MTSRTSGPFDADGFFGRQGFGSMRLREDPDQDPSPENPSSVIGTALDLGVRMVDTADAYRNEELVGRAIRDRRDEVTLASKFGLVWPDDGATGFDVRADPAYVRAANEASLRRLGVDVIDLYYLHHRSDRVPIEETVGAMAQLIEQGRVRALGLSNVTAEDLRRAHAVHPIAALQEQWSILQRDLEADLVPTAAELGVTIVAHSPTGHGLLQAGGRASAKMPAEAATLLVRIAADHDATLGQVALAWVHHRHRAHGVRVLPLPGTTRTEHLRENLAAAELELTAAELSQLDELAQRN